MAFYLLNQQGNGSNTGGQNATLPPGITRTSFTRRSIGTRIGSELQNFRQSLQQRDNFLKLFAAVYCCLFGYLQPDPVALVTMYKYIVILLAPLSHYRLDRLGMQHAPL